MRRSHTWNRHTETQLLFNNPMRLSQSYLLGLEYSSDPEQVRICTSLHELYQTAMTLEVQRETVFEITGKVDEQSQIL